MPIIPKVFEVQWLAYVPALTKNPNPNKCTKTESQWQCNHADRPGWKVFGTNEIATPL